MEEQLAYVMPSYVTSVPHRRPLQQGLVEKSLWLQSVKAFNTPEYQRDPGDSRGAAVRAAAAALSCGRRGLDTLLTNEPSIPGTRQSLRAGVGMREQT